MKREPLMDISPDQKENKYFFSAYYDVQKWEPSKDLDPTVKERCLFMADKLAKRLKVEAYTPEWSTRSVFIPEIMAVGIHYTTTPEFSEDYWFAGFRLVLDETPYWQACICLKDEFIDIQDTTKSEYWVNTAPRKNLYKGTQIILDVWVNAVEVFEANVKSYLTEHKIGNLPRKVELEFNDEQQLIRTYPKKKDSPVVVAYKKGQLPVILDLPVYWAIMNSDSKNEFRTTFDWPL